MGFLGNLFRPRKVEIEKRIVYESDLLRKFKMDLYVETQAEILKIIEMLKDNLKRELVQQRTSLEFRSKTQAYIDDVIMPVKDFFVEQGFGVKLYTRDHYEKDKYMIDFQLSINNSGYQGITREPYRSIHDE
jgi:hypothetical protein